MTDFTPRTENGYIEDVCIHGFRESAVHCCDHVDGNVVMLGNAVTCLDCEDYLADMAEEDYEQRLSYWAEGRWDKVHPVF